MSAKRTSSLLIDEHPLTVQPSLAAALGVNAAILLQQINYWVKLAEKHGEKEKDYRKRKDGEWWTYNTYSQWQEQMPWLSESGIRKLVKQLRDKDLIAVVKHGKQGHDHTLWYSINYEAVENLRTEGHSDVSGCDVSDGPSGTDHDVSLSDVSYATETPETSTESTSSSSTDVLESGDRPENGAGPPPEEKAKPQDLKQYAVAELMKRVSSARARGAPVHDPLDRDRAQYARFFATRSKVHEVETLLLVFDYMVAKASGEVEGEPKAWCGFDTALDFVLAGWRPPKPSGGYVETEEQRLLREENERESARLVAEFEAEREAEVPPASRPRSPEDLRRMLRDEMAGLGGRPW